MTHFFRVNDEQYTLKHSLLLHCVTNVLSQLFIIMNFQAVVMVLLGIYCLLHKKSKDRGLYHLSLNDGDAHMT